MKIRLLTSIFFIVIITAAISACGDSNDTTSINIYSEVPDPCGLFTKADAQTILGEPVAEVATSEETGKKSCTYKSREDESRTASVSIIKPCSMMDYANYAESPDAVAIEGIGMHASWDKTTLIVHSKSGDTCIYASGGGNPPGSDPADDKPALEQAKKVAVTVLGRLEPGPGDSGTGM